MSTSIILLERNISTNYVEITRRPLSTGIFSATLLLQKKYGEGEDRTHDLLAGKHEKISSTSPGSNPRPTGWESNK